MQCVLVAAQYIRVAKQFTGEAPAASLAYVKNPLLIVEQEAPFNVRTEELGL